jgi:tetratricopeptide (TPR) repeat protein
MSRALTFPRLLPCMVVAAVAAGCASAPSPSVPRDRFPLDPREGLTGPFDSSVEKGWQALLSRDTARAEREFGRAESGPSRRAAVIGQIEALVMSGRSSDAIPLCADALAEPAPTAALLSACGEARARTAQPAAAVGLYEEAAALAPNRPGLAERANELRTAAAEDLLDSAARHASAGEREQANVALKRALAWSPRSGPILARVAAVECEMGERGLAMDHYREALALGDLPAEAEADAAALALEEADYETAVSLYTALAARDPEYADRAAQARLAFRIANWPEPERVAARAKRLTRSGAANLTWWMFPEVREARVTGGLVATDVLERTDSRAVMRAISLGLLEVDPDTHRARPDAALTRAAAARWLLRLSAFLGRAALKPGCPALSGATARAGTDTIAVAVQCGLLKESGGSVVGGEEFTRGLDRLRSMFPTGEGREQ